MKFIKPIALLALAAVSVAPAASANTAVNVHGGAFVSILQDPGHLPCYFYDGDGITYSTAQAGCTSTGGGQVIASVPRVPNDSTMTVYIDGTHNFTATTYCSVDTWDWDGRYVATRSINTGSVNGTWEISTTLTTTEAPFWAYLDVRCTMAGASKLRGVILN